MSRRYPIEPLLALLAERGLSTTAAGLLLGCSGSSMKDALERGVLVKAADRFANRAGYHPAEVWPTWVSDAEEAARRQSNEWKRQWRRTPRGRASELASQQRWREECRDYKRAADRERAARLRAEDPERKRELDRAYWERNRDRINAARRARRQGKKAESGRTKEKNAPGLLQDPSIPTSTGDPQGKAPSDPQGIRRRITAVGFDSRMENR